MMRFRNLFVRFSVISTVVACGLTLPFSGAAAAGLLLGSAASVLAMLGRLRAAAVATKPGVGVRFALYRRGFARWAAYGAAFCLVYEFAGARGAGVMGVTFGLLLPLAVVVAIGATGADLKETAD